MSVPAATRSAVASSWLSLLHLRVERGAFALAFVVVAATCFLFAAMPRAFAGFADRALRHEVAAASPAARGVRVSAAARIPAGAAAAPSGRSCRLRSGPSSPRPRRSSRRRGSSSRPGCRRFPGPCAT